MYKSHKQLSIIYAIMTTISEYTPINELPHPPDFLLRDEEPNLFSHGNNMNSLETRLRTYPVPILKKMLKNIKTEVGAISRMKKDDLVKKILDLKKKGFPIAKNISGDYKPKGTNYIDNKADLDILSKAEVIKNIKTNIARDKENLKNALDYIAREKKRGKKEGFSPQEITKSLKNRLEDATRLRKTIKRYEKDLETLK